MDLTPGVRAHCDRCSRELRVSTTRRENAKPFRRAKEPKGVCPECVVTQFLYNTYPVNMIIDEAGPELLLKPGIRDAVVMSGILNDSDMGIDEINWALLVSNWKLPVKIDKKDGRNPYRMGDSPRATPHNADAPQEIETEGFFVRDRTLDWRSDG